MNYFTIFVPSHSRDNSCGRVSLLSLACIGTWLTAAGHCFTYILMHTHICIDIMICVKYIYCEMIVSSIGLFETPNMLDTWIGNK